MADFLTSKAQSEFFSGIALFNSGRFFEAHELLEDAWRSVPSDQQLKLHCQSIVQLAVAFHHQSTGNFVGAQSVLERALRNLSGAEMTFPELKIDELRSMLQPWQRYFSDINTPLSLGKDLSQHLNSGARLLSPPPLPIIILDR